MKKTNKRILGAVVLIIGSGLTLSNASANPPVPASGAAQEVAKQTTGEMAKEAANEVADSAKEKAIGMAKEEANKAVDSGMDKVADSMKPKEKAAEAAKEASK